MNISVNVHNLNRYFIDPIDLFIIFDKIMDYYLYKYVDSVKNSYSDRSNDSYFKLNPLVFLTLL